MVEVTGYSMQTLRLPVCESTCLLLTRCCCRYVPARWQFVVLKRVVCIQILHLPLKICCWNTGGFKRSVCVSVRVTVPGHSDEYASFFQKNLYSNSPLPFFSCFGISSSRPTSPLFLSLCISNYLPVRATDPSQRAFSPHAAFPVPLAQVPTTSFS